MLIKSKLRFLLCVAIFFLFSNTSQADSELPVLRGVGGNFVSDSSLGYEVNLSDYKDNIVLLFFGYTNCPDVCPLTLGYLNSVFTKLSIEQQQKVKVLFVTVNPEYELHTHSKKRPTKLLNQTLANWLDSAIKRATSKTGKRLFTKNANT